MKRMFIALVGASIVCLFFSLASGAALDVAPPPPLGAAGVAPMSTRESGVADGSIPTVTVASMVSSSGSVTTSVVSCLGDSVTYGTPYGGNEPEKTYPGQLQVLLDAANGPGRFEVVNHGVGGYTADQVLADLQNPELNWMGEDPDFVLLMVGGNDLKAAEQDPFTLPAVISQTVAEVQEIVNLVTAHTNADGAHPQIIVSAIIPTQDVGESLAVGWYNNSLQDDLTGMDLWTTSNWDDFLEGGKAKAEYMSDNVHPNETGYGVIAENWFEAMGSLPVRAAFTAWPTTGVAPLAVVFTNTSTGDYTASLWDFGDEVTNTLTSPTHTYRLGGVYTITLTVRGPGGSDVAARAGYVLVEHTVYLPVVLRDTP